METLGKFGLDPVLLIAQLFNFLVIAWVINRFLLRPLMANMKKRKDKIAQGLADAEAARKALAEASAEREKVLQEASAEASRILQNARDEGERVRQASLERAGKDAQRLVAEARASLALERQGMEKGLQGLSLELSGKILESAMEGLFTDEEKARIVARGLERIGAAGRS
jgi:F-type H+-transporting ATPase subunit b